MTFRYLLFPLAGLLTLPTFAEPMPVEQLLSQYRAQGAESFSVERGGELWKKKFGDRSCTLCHTDNPKAAGKHQKTGKRIEPIAPSANAKRLSRTKTIKKWLLRNCKWTLGRECTAQEKGDLLTWLGQQ